MPALFASENRRKRLETDYTDLERVREEKIGFIVEDPITSGNAVESLLDMRHLADRLEELKRTAIGRKSFRKRLSGFFDRNDDRIVSGMLNDISRAKQEYEKRTMSRSLYGLLTPLAFCSKDNLSTVMGDKRSEEMQSMTWIPQFQQLTSKGVGFLDLTGITKEALDKWWFEDDAEHTGEVCNVWIDIKNLALKLVYAFDETFKGRYCAEFPTKLKSMRFRFKRLGIALARLIYIRHEYIVVIQPLFELFVPITFSFSKLVYTETWIDVQDAAIQFLASYLNEMEAGLNDVLVQLNAADELEEYMENDDKSWDKSKSSSKKDADPFDVSLCARDSLTTKLTALEIPEIIFDPSDIGETLGCGSFSEVRKMSSQDGSIYAVKFFKKKASLGRTQDRILREAGRWHGLSHPNVNTLVGFCVHPQRNLPGLISKVLKSNLRTYLDENDVKDLDRLGFLTEVAEALRYLHEERRLAHGDVRPENILLDSELTVKISDFGVSYYEESNDKTTTNQHTHKYYLAPELDASKNKEGPRQVSQKGDIYAFGCCFLEVFCDIEIQADTISKLKKAANSTKRRPVIPGEKIDIQLQHWQFLERVWDKRPEKRPSAKELVDGMRNFMN
ncbi:ATMRK1 [Sanghuangporus weigelae]